MDETLIIWFKNFSKVILWSEETLKILGKYIFLLVSTSFLLYKNEKRPLSNPLYLSHLRAYFNKFKWIWKVKDRAMKYT